jgi:chemotaxis protein MotB
MSSCVSKKKHLQALSAADQFADSLQFNLNTAYQVIDSFHIRLAEERGANRALLETQDKLNDRIILLDDEIERLEEQAANNAQNLGGRIEQREQEIARLETQLEEIGKMLSSRDEALLEIEKLLKDTLSGFDSTAISLVYQDGALILAVLSDFLFASGSTTRMEKQGENALRSISSVLTAYPLMDVLILGHTDNTELRRSSIQNKWEFSSLRASTLAHMMTRRYDLSTSRVMAAGKGEFAPRATNTTKEGRVQNERMEIIIQPAQKSLIRDLKRKLENKN